MGGHPGVAPQDLSHQLAPVRGAAAVAAHVQHHIGGGAQGLLFGLHVGDQGGQFGVVLAGGVAVERRSRDPEAAVVEMLQGEVGADALHQPGATFAQIIGRGAPVEGIGPGRAVGLETAGSHLGLPRVFRIQEHPVAEAGLDRLQEPAAPELADALLGQWRGVHPVAVDQPGAQRRGGGIGLLAVGHHLIGAAIDGQEAGPAGREAEVPLGHADLDVAVLEAGDIGAQRPPPAASIRGRLRPFQGRGQPLVQAGAELGIEGIMHAWVAVDHDVVQAGGVLDQGRRPVARLVHRPGRVGGGFLRQSLGMGCARHRQTGGARRQKPLHVQSPFPVWGQDMAGRRGGFQLRFGHGARISSLRTRPRARPCRSVPVCRPRRRRCGRGRRDCAAR
ncbi:hypothetical protein D3C80_1045370 [compost metagenome]